MWIDIFHFKVQTWLWLCCLVEVCCGPPTPDRYSSMSADNNHVDLDLFFLFIIIVPEKMPHYNSGWGKWLEDLLYSGPTKCWRLHRFTSFYESLPEGRLGMSDVTLLSGISGLSLPSCLESQGSHYPPVWNLRAVITLLSGISGLSLPSCLESQGCHYPPVWNLRAVITLLSGISGLSLPSCLESQGCHLTPFSYLLSCFSA